jgi:iron complex outermembrane receptor protein
VNAGKSIHPGLETEIRWNITKTQIYPGFAFIGNATFSNYHFQDFIDLDSDYSGNNLPGTSRNAWMLMAVISPVKNTGITLWHRYTGEMPVNDANSDYSGAFGITNAELKFNANIKKLKLELKGGIQNIFDIHYASMLAVNTIAFGNSLPRYYYPGNPRNYYVSLLIGLE